MKPVLILFLLLVPTFARASVINVQSPPTPLRLTSEHDSEIGSYVGLLTHRFLIAELGGTVSLPIGKPVFFWNPLSDPDFDEEWTEWDLVYGFVDIVEDDLSLAAEAPLEWHSSLSELGVFSWREGGFMLINDRKVYRFANDYDPIADPNNNEPWYYVGWDGEPFRPSAIPEPSALSLLGLGVIAGWLASRRRV